MKKEGGFNMKYPEETDYDLFGKNMIKDEYGPNPSLKSIDMNLDLKTKYYTPTIQDIRVGYECELDTSSTINRWKKVKVINMKNKQ
jgi:hypothetical protein